MLTLNCKNCKHFKTYEEVDLNGFGHCKCNKFQYMNAYKTPDDSYPKDGLIYVDGDGFAADPLVGPEFGCIHFHERDNQ